MAMPRSGGAVVGVRLTEIDVKIRRRRGRALYEAAVADRNIDLAMQLNAAIERPSETVYWVPKEAVRKLNHPRP